jgi:type II secretory pathway pseudopilin PulG
MRSVTCPSCGFVSWAGGGDCKQCGKPLPPDQTYQRPQPPPSYGYGAPQDYFGAPQKKRVGHAVASLAIGIAGFCTFGLFLIGSVVGTILGVVALNRANKSPATHGGKGLAIAGIILNVFALVSVVPIGIIAAIAIPNLLASRRAANEASAVNYIRSIASAEATFQSTVGDGQFGDLGDLLNNKLVDPRLSSAVRNGYCFNLVSNGEDFEVTATPVSEATGRRSFFYSSDDEELRARVDGLPATASDPPVRYYEDYQRSRGGAAPMPHGPAYIPAN